MYEVYKTDNIGVSSSTLGKGPAVVSHTVAESGPLKARGNGPGERQRLSENACRDRADLSRGDKMRS